MMILEGSNNKYYYVYKEFYEMARTIYVRCTVNTEPKVIVSLKNLETS